MSVPPDVLVVDHERSELDALTCLLHRDERLGTVRGAASGVDALRVLGSAKVGIVFLDIAMPELSGLDIARLLARFSTPPKVVFVAAHSDYAVDAVRLNVVDYLMKPAREGPLRESVRRALDTGTHTRCGPSETAYVEATGDYVRFHTANGKEYLVRATLSMLEREWKSAGFIRIHRSLIVSSAHIREMRVHNGHCSVVVECAKRAVELHVARRHTHELRYLLRDRYGHTVVS